MVVSGSIRWGNYTYNPYSGTYNITRLIVTHEPPSRAWTADGHAMLFKPHSE